MNLTFDEIKSLTHGADRVTIEDDGLHFYKCTERQEAAWIENKMPQSIVRATTGIRLEFSTDAEAITFSAPSGGKFEIWVNGMFYRQILANVLREAGETPCVKLGKGTKKVMLALPSHTAGVLSSLSLEGATFYAPVTYDKKILFIGDSITQGWNSKYDTLSYAYRTATTLGADFHICGFGGGRYIPETFDLVNFDPDTIVVAFGVNDFSSTHRTAEDNMANARGFLARVKAAYPNRRVLVITPIWVPEKDEAWHAIARASIAKVAKEQGFEVVDGATLSPQNTDFYADSVHPNELGFSIYAERLVSYFKNTENKR